LMELLACRRVGCIVELRMMSAIERYTIRRLSGGVSGKKYPPKALLLFSGVGGGNCHFKDLQRKSYQPFLPLDVILRHAREEKDILDVDIIMC